MRRFRDALILILLILVIIISGCKPVPKINIEKYTNGVDADEPPGPEIFVGEEVVWTYIVTNAGSTELEAVVVTDNMGRSLYTSAEMSMQTASCKSQRPGFTGPRG